ncbi:hypothetical protein [Streptomyces geranii]|uniref:hypothetical protein n=1 Tax=Streptomyces geranii TaxID=2058923 RepID=UPI000D03E64D|nr:hypothetical protein [Streptomyces geranii]
MDKPELVSDTLAVVVLGEFDPLVVTPRWLRQMDLIGAEDYESYRTDLISSNGTLVHLGSIDLKVLPDTLEVKTDAIDDVEVARDLAAGILLSSGTPRISAMGINRVVHFSARFEEWHAIGDALTPKDLWNDVLHLPGMANIGICAARNDGYSGSVNIQVQPSVVVQPGVFVSVNDHHTLTQAAPPTGRTAPALPEQTNLDRSVDKVAVATKILTEDFSSSRLRAQSIIDRVASLGSAARGRQ